MGTSPQAQQQFVSNLLAIARLKQLSDANTVQMGLREQVMQERAEKTKAAAEANRQKSFDMAVSRAFGTKPSPDLDPYTAEAPPLFDPGAQVQAGISTGGTSPSGFPTFSMINRSPTQGDIAGVLGRGRERLRGETLAEAQSRGIDKNEPALYERLQTEIASTTPKDVAGRLADFTAAGKGRSDARTAAATARKAESDATVAEDTQLGRIREQGYVERQKKAAAENAEIDVTYAEAIKKADLRLKELDEQLKRGTLAQQPYELEKAKSDLQTARLTRDKLDLEVQGVRRKRILTDAYHSAKTPEEQNRVLRHLMAENGHEAGLLSEHRDVREAYVRATETANKSLVMARAAIESGKVEEGQALTTQHNAMQIAAADIMGSPKVVLTTVAPTRGIFGGISGANVGQARVDTDVAKMYTNGDLDKASRGEVRLPDVIIQKSDGSQQVLKRGPAWALAEKIRIEQAWAGNDPAVFARAIEAANADPLVKQDALQGLKQASQSVTPVKGGGTEDVTRRMGEGPEPIRSSRATVPMDTTKGDAGLKAIGNLNPFDTEKDLGLKAIRRILPSGQRTVE